MTMATMKIEVPQEVFQIKITLLGSKPPIWRRLLVSADMTLERLHGIIQLAMGWQNSHLHEFEIGGERFGESVPDDELMGMPAAVNERRVRLSSVLGHKGAKGVYTYDFGDSWAHSIVVEKVLPLDPGLVYPLCLDGKGHGPPEDCGGIYGYYNLLEAIGDPDHSEHEELLEWIGEGFDPDAFSVDDVNTRLAPLRRRRAKAKGA
jgi:hypothetical protein